MIIRSVTVGQMKANCYILGCKKTRQAVIIDPGDDYQKIINCLKQEGLEPKIVINTHGHIDHIAVNDKFNLPIYIHELDAECLINPTKNLSAFFGPGYTSPTAVRLLKDKDEIEVGEINLRVIHTPGHTPGGICLTTDNIVFTGDTLFCRGIGRTDFPGASEKDLIASIKEKIFALSDKTVVYPGHGPYSTVGSEAVFMKKQSML
ncbi:MAG: MBL fold metallo-hydrolase [Candidatus Omnitrophota bacterium]|nr:MBL fold metallo-hydrolase [Candidatus Omnitrophota bacterium]